MKILLLIRSFNRGGAERQFVNLAKGLKVHGINVRVAVFYAGGPLQQELEEAGVTIMWLGKRSRWDILRPLLRFVKEVKLERPMVIYAWMPLSNIVAVVSKPFLPKKTRVVWGVRASNMDWSRYNWLSWVSWKIQMWLSRFADLIIANSYAGREYAIRQGFSNRAFEVIPNGIDTEKFRILSDDRIKLRKEWGIRDNQLLIGLVARLDPMKDHPLFLRAAAMLVKEQGNVRFVCIGDGTEVYKMELQQFSHKLGLDSLLIWAGVRSDTPAVYNALDILASSSYGEGFSNVIAEAMACGVPCVVTDVGDSAWIVGDTGIVVPPKNSELFISALLRMLDRICAQKDFALGKQCRKRIIEKFSVTTLITTSSNIMNKNNPDIKND